MLAMVSFVYLLHTAMFGLNYYAGSLSDDMRLEVGRYTVAELETLGKYDVEEMTSGDWDLTLFTCTYGGQSRVTVRCLRTAEK